MKLTTYEKIGIAVGWIFCISPAFGADAPLTHHLPFITLSMLLATFMGAVGSYLAFGEDKKFPPSATSVGHMLLGFGAGLFFSRGSLELMGNIDASDNVVIFVSFLWAVAGYFALRLFVAVVNSEQLKAILPDWVTKFFK